MAHGLPSGYVRLYDEAGNAVDVDLGTDGKYTLAVKDERAVRLLETILQRLTPVENENPWSGKVSW